MDRLVLLLAIPELAGLNKILFHDLLSLVARDRTSEQLA